MDKNDINITKNTKTKQHNTFSNIDNCGKRWFTNIPGFFAMPFGFVTLPVKSWNKTLSTLHACKS